MIKILDVVYGKTHLSACPRPRIKTANCRRPPKNDIVRKCDSKPTCKPGARHKFGDCSGTHTYINVTYHCVTTGIYIYIYYRLILYYFVLGAEIRQT